MEEEKLGDSVGIACADGEVADADELINRADQAMYQAKRAGKGRLVFWSEAIGN